MIRRSSFPRWCNLRVVGLAAGAFACLPVAAGAGAPCSIDAPVTLTLTITAGALPAGTDRDTVVRVHADGCAQVHRPAYLRNAGDYRIALAADELRQLSERVERGGLQRFDASQVRAQLSVLQKSSGAQRKSAGDEIFTVLDADRYEVRWHDATSPGSAAWTALPEYAQAFPEVAALQGLNDVAAALQAIALRADGAAP